MNYEEFKSYVLGHIKDYLGEMDPEIDMKIEQTENKLFEEVGALVLSKPDREYSTNIFLDKAYVAYMGTGDMEPIMKDIAATVRKSEKQLNKMEAINLNSFEGIKERLSVQILNAERNQSQLQVITHRKIPETDLAVVYRIEVASNRDGFESVKVTNKMLDIWGIREEQLYQAALEQNMKKYPFIIADAGQFLFRAEPVPEQYPEEMKEKRFYYLTNSNIVNGAATILYPDILKTIGDKFQGNYFILPSSIHEVLLMKDDGEINVEELQSTVRSVNDESVPEGDILSDQVYAYDRENERFYQVSEREETWDHMDQGFSGMEERNMSEDVYASYADEVIANEEHER